MPAKLEVAFFQVGRLHCCCCCVNQVVVMLVGIYHDLVGIYHDEKIREVCIKVRLPPALLAVVGQVTKHTSVKWRIGRALYRNRMPAVREELFSGFYLQLLTGLCT